MIERIMEMGIEVKHLWGMTETSPIGTAGHAAAALGRDDADEQLDLVGKQGRSRSASSCASSTTTARCSRATA